MPDIIFTVPHAFFEIDDDRVRKLRRNEITQLEFMGMARADDPWEIKNGRLIMLDDTIIKKKCGENAVKIKAELMATGGLLGGTIYHNRDAVLKCFPEMAQPLDKAVEILKLNVCPGCINSKLAFLVDDIFKVPFKADRDLAPLGELFPKYALKLLKHEPFEIPPEELIPPEFAHLMQLPAPVDAAPAAPLESFRPACMNCCRKHLGQAIVLLGESRLGYPVHKWLAVGHLAEASEEIYGLYPELAVAFREERIKIMENPEHVPDLVHYFTEMDMLDSKGKK